MIKIEHSSIESPPQSYAQHLTDINHISNKSKENENENYIFGEEMITELKKVVEIMKNINNEAIAVSNINENFDIDLLSNNGKIIIINYKYILFHK
jgi:hypothetical protein